MITARSERLREILADPVFKDTVAALQARQTRIVMAPATSVEDRESALAEHHALHRLLVAMQAATEESND